MTSELLSLALATKKMKKFKRYTITAALPYANGPLHIGHIAGAYLPADIYVRFLRLRENDVIFICGSDEHGAAITLKAKKENISPQQLVDKYHEQMKKAFADFGIDFSICATALAEFSGVARRFDQRGIDERKCFCES